MITLTGGFLDPTLEIGAGSSNSARRRRDTSTSKPYSLLLTPVKGLLFTPVKGVVINTLISLFDVFTSIA